MNVRFPIGELELPNNVTLEDVQEWLGDIEGYVHRLRQVADDLNESELSKQYREGSWTVRQLVHHIADSQINMYQRLKLSLTDNNPMVEPFIQDEWVEVEDNNLPVECSLRIMEGINERIVAVGHTLTTDDLKRTFTLKGEGKNQVSEQIAKLAWHEAHHLAHIKIALSN
ncbi:YfiT family bacillithiol transferase [Staphylococcus nepalensis]|uniref:YfiT family bacillithiol transferase n=1 Tax=Staphylococcus nepalensis TaxID=214473 RepID=UPI001A9903A3|nr:putative metal-dependent hydrolase [Staphylococcus nepalensis]MBO1206313.1 putative metal-dependent hydrolase [Staphylococcus nepalensis]